MKHNESVSSIQCDTRLMSVPFDVDLVADSFVLTFAIHIAGFYSPINMATERNYGIEEKRVLFYSAVVHYVHEVSGWGKSVNQVTNNDIIKPLREENNEIDPMKVISMQTPHTV